jgi:hypothetical protein
MPRENDARGETVGYLSALPAIVGRGWTESKESILRTGGVLSILALLYEYNLGFGLGYGDDKREERSWDIVVLPHEPESRFLDNLDVNLRICLYGHFKSSSGI